MERYVDAGIYRGSRADMFAALSKSQPALRSVLSLQRWRADELPARVESFALPLGVLLPPREAELKAAILLLDALPKPTYLHCKSGVDRTGAVVAYYRVLRQGHRPARAINEMFDSGFHRVRYHFWLPSLQRILSRAWLNRDNWRQHIIEGD